jgi:hypothetical protein
MRRLSGRGPRWPQAGHRRAAALLAAACAALALPVPNALARGERAAFALDSNGCSYYTSPSGSDANNGRTPSTPVTLPGVLSKPVAGDVVCILPGTYTLSQPLYLTHTGAAGAPIVYKGFGGQAILRRDPSGSTSEVMQVTASYVTVSGLTFDGSYIAGNAVLCRSAHHLQALGNVVLDMGSGGIVALGCDYVTVDHNLIWRVGYLQGFASGISLNSSVWSDRAAGFHSYVTNNIVSGTEDASSHHSDGNGIIMDLGDAVPPVLIANNLVYMNYGRCIHSFHQWDLWVVNNTCYSNGLREPTFGSGFGTGEINMFASLAPGSYIINNVVQAWTYSNAYRSESNSALLFARNVAFGGQALRVPASVTNDPNQIRVTDPRFLAPLPLDPTAQAQWRNAPAPWAITTQFYPGPGSPLVDRGVDPRTIAASDPALVAGMTAVLTTDLAGNPRVSGGGWDIGAFELNQAAPPAPPAPLPPPPPPPTPLPPSSAPGTPGAPVVAAAPANTVLPGLQGSPLAGNVLECTAGTWGNQPTIFDYAWTRDGKRIEGQETTQLKTKVADTGHAIRCTVTARNSIGSTTATSAAVKVQLKPRLVKRPTVRGAARVGKTLSCLPGSWRAYPTVKKTYRWLRNGKPIKRATKRTHKVTRADVGKRIACRLTARNALGRASATSPVVRARR